MDPHCTGLEVTLHRPEMTLHRPGNDPVPDQAQHCTGMDVVLYLVQGRFFKVRRLLVCGGTFSAQGPVGDADFEKSIFPEKIFDVAFAPI
jgi:hypothetical protein